MEFSVIFQILDRLGLGPSGPPIPPTAFYSVIHYPEKRVAPTGEALKHFTFIMPEGAMAEEEKKESESLVDVPITPTMKVPGQRGRVGEMEKNHCRRAVMGSMSAGTHSTSLA